VKRLALILVLVSPSLQAMPLSTLACGAIICLAGDGGTGCAPYLNKYNSIEGPTSAITKRLRKAFLALCDKQEAPDLTAMEQARAVEISTLKNELEITQ